MFNSFVRYRTDIPGGDDDNYDRNAQTSEFRMLNN